jgi:hypothetical protein
MAHSGTAVPPPIRTVFSREQINAARSGRQQTASRFTRAQRALSKLVTPTIIKDKEIRELAGQASALYRARIEELIYETPTVSALIAEGSRSFVLSARYAHRATELGLDSPEGRLALELSMKLGARAERTAITALDLSARLAQWAALDETDPHSAAADLFGAPANENGASTSQPPANPAKSKGRHGIGRPVVVDGEDADELEQDDEGDDHPTPVAQGGTPPPSFGFTRGEGGVLGAPRSQNAHSQNPTSQNEPAPSLTGTDKGEQW